MRPISNCSFVSLFVGVVASALLIGLNRSDVSSESSLVGPAVGSSEFRMTESTATVDANQENYGLQRERSLDLSEKDLIGLWNRYDGRSSGQPLRFWYFHGQGRGLYRYGKVGYSQTHSFSYYFKAGRLNLKFLKSGKEHESEIQVQQDDNGSRWLTFSDDPRDSGAKYRHEITDLSNKAKSNLEGSVLAFRDQKTPKSIGGRIWIDFQNLSSGGHEFRMYQFHASAIDGRGIGWFHQGDFNNWTTESFSYRVDGQRLEFVYDLSRRHEQSSFHIDVDKKGHAALQLENDPRDFWHRHRYPDGGTSFSSLGPFMRILHKYD